MLDLIVLVADKSMQFALEGGLSRSAALGIREISFDIIVHSGRDGGARTSGPDLLRIYRGRFRHALLVLDREGCGVDSPAVAIEESLNGRLSEVWQSEARAIVIDPEVDVWVWGADNALSPILRWSQEVTIREWLIARGFALDDQDKPLRPKEAMEAVLRFLRRPMSAALYRHIAGSISLAKCRDPSFRRLRSQLCTWFPPGGHERREP